MLLPLLVVLCAVQVPTQGNRTRVDVARLGPQAGERVPDFTLPEHLDLKAYPSDPSASLGTRFS
jgi:hypothetical protein